MRLKNGTYKCEIKTDFFDEHRGIVTIPRGTVTMSVRETAAFYILTLISNTSKYDAPQIDDMFREHTRLRISRNKPSRHSIQKWDDHSFTIYPYRVGVPYLFYFQE